MKKIVTALQIIFSQSLYKYVAIIASLIVALTSYWLFYQTTTIPAFLESMKNGDFGPYGFAYGITYIITTFLIVVLSGISISTVIWLFRHSKFATKKAAGGNIGGLVSAAFAMGCPVCGGFLLSAIGIAGGLTIFPLQGLELKFLSLGLLLGSTMYGTSKVKAEDCEACQDISQHKASNNLPLTKKLIILPLQKVAIFALAALFLINQLLIGQVTGILGIAPKTSFASFLGIKTASAYSIIAPKLNPDGKTTSLVEQPTITEVLANPNTGDALADAKVVMLATGKPFYAPEDISFDDPINAQNKWGALEKNIKLSPELEVRYQKLISTMVCSYCCGGPTNVTLNKNCGCAHAKAVRGFYRFMIQNYGDKYSDEQFVGESHRWYAIWYPKGMLEDYLLATGKSEALSHNTHGGAGPDGRHGLK